MENKIDDHLSKLERSPHMRYEGHIRGDFPDEQVLALEVTELPWYADIVNILVSGVFPSRATTQQINKLS